MSRDVIEVVLGDERRQHPHLPEELRAVVTLPDGTNYQGRYALVGWDHHPDLPPCAACGSRHGRWRFSPEPGFQIPAGPGDPPIDGGLCAACSQARRASR